MQCYFIRTPLCQRGRTARLSALATRYLMVISSYTALAYSSSFSFITEALGKR